MTLVEPSRFQCLSPGEAAALIQAEANVSIFDVRDVASYRLGHIADAAHLTEDRLPGWLRRLQKDQPIVIYCYKGHMSQTYAQMFVDFRFTRVFSVDGGYDALAVALSGALM